MRGTGERAVPILAALVVAACARPDATGDHMGIRVGYAAFEGARVAYREAGAGERAIVFVHGYGGDGSVWDRQLSGLDIHRRLVAVDLIGHGKSDAPDASYSMDYMARSVAAVADHLQINKLIIVGWSNGVPVARQFYRAYPARTEALVAVDGPLVQIMSRERGEQMLAPLRRPDYRETLRMMMGRKPPGAESLPDDVWRQISEAQLAIPQHVLVGSAEAMLEPAIWSTDRIRVPVLAVYGSSPMWTADYQRKVAAVASDLEYQTLEGASHFLAIERAQQFNAILEGFIGGLESRGGR